jgi:WD40 repeat protein
MITALALGGAGLLVAAILNVLGNRISNPSTSSHNNTQPATASHNQPISSSASNQVVGKLIYTYQGLAGRQNPIFYISWSPDSKRIATANAKSLHIWDAATGGNVTTSSHGVVNPDDPSGNDHFAWIGDKLYAAIMDIKDYQNPMIRIMDLANDKEVFTYQGYATEKHPYGNAPSPSTLQWSPNSTLIASLDYDTGVRVWNASNGQVISRFKVQSGDNGITDDTLLHETYLAWAADGQHLATWSFNTAIVRVWDTSNGQLLCSYRKHWDQHGKDNPDHPQVYALVYWSPDSTRIASIVPQTKPTDGVVHVWDAHSGNQICTFSALPHNVTMQLQWSADSKLIACVMNNATVQVWDASNGAPVTVRYETPGLDYIDWNPKRRFIASTMQSITNQSEFIKAHIWDATSAKEVTQLSNDVWSLAWAPDGMQIAIATLNNEIQIWQVWQ